MTLREADDRRPPRRLAPDALARVSPGHPPQLDPAKVTLPPVARLAVRNPPAAPLLRRFFELSHGLAHPAPHAVRPVPVRNWQSATISFSSRATGRVPFRVHYTVPHHERKFWQAEQPVSDLVHARFLL